MSNVNTRFKKTCSVNAKSAGKNKIKTTTAVARFKKTCSENAKPADFGFNAKIRFILLV